MMGDTGYADPYAPGGMRRPGAQQVDPYSPPPPSSPITSQPSPLADKGQADMTGTQAQGLLQQGEQQKPPQQQNPMLQQMAQRSGGGGSVLQDVASLIPLIVSLAG